MNVLFVTPSFPSRLHRIRAYQLIKYLSRYHRVHLLSFLPFTQEPYDREEMDKYCESVTVVKQSLTEPFINAFFALPRLRQGFDGQACPIPFEMAFCQSRSLQEEVSRLVQTLQPDLVYVKRLRLLPNVLRVVNAPVVIDATDAVGLYYEKAKKIVPWFRKPLYYHEASTYDAYERRALQRFPHWVVCAPEDQAYLQKKVSDGSVPKTLVELIPNGVDTEYYTFLPWREKARNKTILFSGLMHKYVNISAATWLVREVLPHVIKDIPEVKCLLVGPRPTIEVKSLAGANALVTGLVPDLRPFLEQASVVCCPVLTGAGARNKILQAWAMGTPVVTTTEGAKGLDVAHGQNALVADSPAGFAHDIVRLLTEPDLAEHLTINGHLLVNEKYSCYQVVALLNAYLERLLR